jgi:hypothetical protein
LRTSAPGLKLTLCPSDSALNRYTAIEFPSKESDGRGVCASGRSLSMERPGA